MVFCRDKQTYCPVSFVIKNLNRYKKLWIAEGNMGECMTVRFRTSVTKNG